MSKLNHAMYFRKSMTQKLDWTKSLKTEDKVLLGIALFVGASAISLVTVGGVIWNRVSPSAESQRAVQESFDQFDQYQDDFSQSLKNAVTAFKENHQIINDAHMKHLGNSTDSMQDAFDEHMAETHKQMNANWEIIKQDALKRITAPLNVFDESTNMRKGN